ncbi:MAG: hypothetical protein KDB23_18340, partial [Planctomycetales bacterium]|nr:hypothetical protein [Planctomycetales bacterium]
GRPSVRDAIATWARDNRVALRTHVVTDVEALLSARSSGESVVPATIALISGTGSIAWGRDATGREARAGGWGSLLGDEGSGYALVVSALRAITRAADEAVPLPAYAASLLEELGVVDLPELPAKLARMSRHEIARLATPLCTRFAENEVAVLLDDVAVQLARLVICVARKLQLSEDDYELVLGGGVLNGVLSLQQQLLVQLAAADLRPHSTRCLTDVAGEAARLAVTLAGMNP